MSLNLLPAPFCLYLLAFDSLCRITLSAEFDTRRLFSDSSGKRGDFLCVHLQQQQNFRTLQVAVVTASYGWVCSLHVNVEIWSLQHTDSREGFSMQQQKCRAQQLTLRIFLYSLGFELGKILHVMCICQLILGILLCVFCMRFISLQSCEKKHKAFTGVLYCLIISSCGATHCSHHFCYVSVALWPPAGPISFCIIASQALF